MRVVAQALKVLLALLPKRNTAAVHTWPAFDDTARALIPELERSGLARIYYLAAGDVVAGEPPAWGPKVCILRKRSLRAVWAFLTSRYIIASHHCYASRFPRQVESVNVWHGMPIKRIGWMASNDLHPPQFKHDLATSDFWVPIVKRCMRPHGGVLVNGLPRCDRFRALERAEVLRRLGGEAMACSKLAVWLPTYRKSVRGDPAEDGAGHCNEAQMPGFDVDEFEEWLAERNMVCVVKPHPLGPSPRLRGKGHLRLLDDAALGALGLTLYELLGGSDVLLTDVSSVYVDYLLLDRPVIHTFADRNAYGVSRGYTFDWTEDYFAGPMVDDMGGVKSALEEVAVGGDPCREKRARLRALFHARPDEPAAAALLQKIGLGPAVSPARG